MRKNLLVTIGVVASVGLLYFLFTNPYSPPHNSDLFTIPLLAEATRTPTIVKTMPQIVEDSMESLLQSLETELEMHDPGLVRSLQPCITLEELDRAEAILGQDIHPELRALYSWHNGIEDGKEFIPGHTFWSLEDSIRTNQEANREYQRRGVGWLMVHEKNWLVLFPDPAGDGYYYDPARRYDTGGIFYNFRESGYYRYFPSIKNLLKAIVECYQNGAYSKDGETDFDLEDRIMDQYSLEKED